MENALEELIAGETENVDRRDRLEAAWELARKQDTSDHPPNMQSIDTCGGLSMWSDESSMHPRKLWPIPSEQTFVPIAAIQGERIAGADLPTAAAGSERQAIVPPMQVLQP